MVKLRAGSDAVSAESQLSSSVAVHLTVVEEQCFFGADAEFLDAHLEYSFVGFAAMSLVGEYHILGIIFQVVAIGAEEIADGGVEHYGVGVREQIDAILLAKALQGTQTFYRDAEQELRETVVDGFSPRSRSGVESRP